MTNFVNRRDVVWAGLGLTLAAAGSAIARTSPAAVSLEVWKSPECGCCKAWLSHLQAQGLNVGAVHNTGNTDVRKSVGIPLALGSCHTARIDGYAIEGHVPAREIKRLLKERPAAVGLAVPGMPLGSPGMDGPDFDNQTQPYDVLLVLKDGTTRVFQSYHR
ncbi:DUF411 domain-containing protein [Mitsuaria sp. CC2]|uniref:DUF411 domain-containing protein n=1 Tax=Roseateles TaxID=93681 RepID=UPI000B4C9863|nr:metal-binding protein [Roseateles noduli]RZI62469.1 MAG: DUF411 domain-containing protein [Rubrivivax sp.]